MKKFVALFVLVLAISLLGRFLPASELRSDYSNSRTYYTVPPLITHCLASSNGPLLCNMPIKCDQYGCGEMVPPENCRKPKRPSRIRFYGWLEGGFYANSHGNTTDHYRALDQRGSLEKFHVPTSGNSSLLGNVQSTEGMLNQLWFGVKRDLDTRQGFDWGFRGDLLYGTDAWLAQSYGDASFDYRAHNRDYYLAVPQVHATLGYRDLSVKIGKFETLLGYEHLQAPDTFFYSHSNLFYTEPQTHSGVLFEHRVDPNLSINFGYVQGADNSFHNRFNDHGFLGGIYWRPLASISVWYTLYASDVGTGQFANGQIRPGGTVFQHTFVTNWKITSCWDYSFQWNLGNRAGTGGAGASYFGTAHYLTRKINAHWTAGLRFDHVHSNGWMFESGFSRPFTGNYIGDLYGLTFGCQWNPNAKLSVRPELRYDHAGDCQPFDSGKRKDQFSAGCGVVYRL